MKDAVLFGLEIGIIAAALFLIWGFGSYSTAPKIAAAAATRKPGFGFQLPE